MDKSNHKEQLVTITEAEWLRRAQAGDQEAFAVLVEMYQQPVYNLCYRMLNSNPQDAEDSAQETFWRAYQSIKRYDPNRSFATWLLSIAAHHCIDQQRRKKLPTLEIDEVLEETAADINIPNPEHSLGVREQQRALRGLLNELSPQDRAAVVLRYWYEFSEAEISQALNLSTSAVKSRLHRARLKLAQAWQQSSVTLAYQERSA